MKSKLTLFFLLLQSTAFAQVEALDSKEAIERFIKEKFDYQEFSLGDSTWYSSDEQKRKADSIGVDYWAKVDLDHDGIQDFFFMGNAKSKESNSSEEVLMLLLGGRQNKKLKINNSFFTNVFERVPVFPKIIKVEGRDFLELTYYFNKNHCELNEEKITRMADTIYVKNDFLIPFTRHPSPLEFKSINLKASACYGPCPVFELFIKHDQSVIYDGYAYTKRKGNYRLRAEAKDVDFISHLIQCLDITSLKDHYNVCWTDDQTVKIDIRYKDGSTKSIEDYGKLGTYKLTLLYDYLFDLVDF